MLAIDEEQRAGLLGAVEVLSRIFWGPDLKGSQDILEGNYLKPFELLKGHADFKPPTVLSELRAFSARFTDNKAIYEHMEQAYVRLFINNRTGITAPLYASAYIYSQNSGKNAPMMGPPAVMMIKRFESKGLSLSETMHEPPDHLSIELEYLYFLMNKGWSDLDRTLLEEAVSFGGEEMFPWVKSLHGKIADEKECRFYPLITSLMLSILSYLTQVGRPSGNS
jgi:TorA-specific chaperone